MDSDGGGIISKDGGGIISKGSQMSPESSSNHQLDPAQNHYCSHHLLRAVLSFAMVTLTCLVLYHTSESPLQFFPRSIHLFSFSQANNSSTTPDADIMWLRNPFPHCYSDANFQISCDSFRGNPTELKNAPNGGFNYVKSSNLTIEFYKFWYKSRELYPRKQNQDVLNRIEYNPFIREIGLEIKFPDTVCFGGFCQPSKDLNLVCTMHANCCAGLDNKIHDLKILLDDWRNYLSPPENVRKTQPPSWSVPQSCG